MTLCVLASVWLLGLVVARLAAPTLGLAIPMGWMWAIGIASGLVALASLLPGMLVERRLRKTGDASAIAVGVSAGMLIRMVGTVALLGMCSYHLPAVREQTAGMILAWYVYLTTIELMVLAKQMPRLDHRLAFKRDALTEPNP